MKQKTLLILNSGLFMFFSFALMGCGFLTRTALKAANIASQQNVSPKDQEKSKIYAGGYECFAMSEAYKFLDKKVCLIGKYIAPIKMSMPNGNLVFVTYDFDGFHLFGNEGTFPDIEVDDCLAAVGTVQDNPDADGSHRYFMDIDDPSFELYSGDGCE